MAVNYVTPLEATRMAAVITAIDVNAQPGLLEIGTTAYGRRAVHPSRFAKPSFTESGGVITMSGAPKSGTASATELRPWPAQGRGATGVMLSTTSRLAPRRPILF